MRFRKPKNDNNCITRFLYLSGHGDAVVGNH